MYEAYDRSAAGNGAFLTVAVNGLAALRTLDLDPAVVLAAGYPTPHLALAGRAGRRLADLPLGGPEPDGTTTTTIRHGDLYAALRAEVERRGIPVAYGKRLVAVDRHPDAVTAVFADGSRVTGALLVGADGLHSRTRRSWTRTRPPRVTSACSTRAASPPPTSPRSSTARPACCI